MKNIDFVKGNWEDEFKYAYSTRFPFVSKFVQEEDCISNTRNPGMKDGFDYTTIITNEMYGKGTKLWFTSLFEEYGAPLITLVDKLKTDKDGNLWYGACYEVVIWENGINVWDLYEEDGEVKWNLLMSANFTLETNVKHELYVELLDKEIRVVLNDKDFNLRIDVLPEKMYIGVTGCENINRLYNLKIDCDK